jgi:hypothetical protein
MHMAASPSLITANSQRPRGLDHLVGTPRVGHDQRTSTGRCSLPRLDRNSQTASDATHRHSSVAGHAVAQVDLLRTPTRAPVTVRVDGPGLSYVSWALDAPSAVAARLHGLLLHLVGFVGCWTRRRSGLLRWGRRGVGFPGPGRYRWWCCRRAPISPSTPSALKRREWGRRPGSPGQLRCRPGSDLPGHHQPRPKLQQPGETGYVVDDAALGHHQTDCVDDRDIMGSLAPTPTSRSTGKCTVLSVEVSRPYEHSVTAGRPTAASHTQLPVRLRYRPARTSHQHASWKLNARPNYTMRKHRDRCR